METQGSINIQLDGLAIETQSVSDYLPEPIDPGLPSVHPYHSQTQIDDFYRQGSPFVASNDAPTGGGKTFSWLTPVVKYGYDALVMYPTKSLASDQNKTVQNFLEGYFPEKEFAAVQIDSGTLNTLREQHPSPSVSNSTLIVDKITQLQRSYENIIVLTNPDIFTLLRHKKYGNYAKRVSELFDTIIVDEFHRANVKGKYMLPFFFDDLYRRDDSSSPTDKFLFLSATPDPSLQGRLEQSTDIPYKPVRTDTHRKPLSKANLNSNWRGIMPPIDMTLIPGSIFSTGDKILSDTIVRDFLEFCQQDKTVIILDSLREVTQVKEFLSENLDDKVVHQIDGFNSDNIQQKLDDFDVLVGNSAVEVGIDFDVDQAIISGYTSSSFLQRLGRVRNQTELKRVVAFSSRQFLTSLSETKALYPNGERIPRSVFRQVISDTLSDGREPELYGRLYGSVEAYSYVQSEIDDQLPENEDWYRKESFEMLRNHFYEPTGVDISPEEVRRLSRLEDSELSQSLKTYRSSDINTLYYNPDKNTVDTYGTLQLLRYGDVTFMSETQFKQRVPDEHLTVVSQLEKHSSGYALYRGRIDTGPDASPQRDVRVAATEKIDKSLQKDINSRSPVVLDGIQVLVGSDETVPCSGVAKLNNSLQSESAICLPIEGTRGTISHHFGLGPYFSIESLGNISGEYSVAVGLSSLYLHAHIVNEKERANELVSSSDTR